MELLTNTDAAAGPLDSASWNLPFGEPASLDPIKAFNYPENTVVANLCEGLMIMTPDYTIEPNLAESVDVDGNTYVYTLRDGVTFWNGDPMTAEDVAFSLKRHLDAEEGSYWTSDAVTGNIESIEVTGDREVTITLKEKDNTFNSYMATPLGVVVQESHREEAGGAYGTPQGGVMCTGPYSVKQWNAAQNIVLTANGEYWNEERTPLTKELTIQFIVDQTAITSALRSGDIDGSYDIPLAAVPELRSSDSGELILGNSLQIMAVISTGEGPLGDPAVRRALWTATDKAGIAEAVYEGTAVAARSLVPDKGWSYGDELFAAGRDELPSTEPDVELAKEILAEADVDTSETISIVYPSERGYYADIISELSRAGAEIGLDVQPEGVPSAQFGAFFSDEEARAGHGAFVTANYMDVPDPLVFLRTIVAEGGSQNFSDFSDPEIQALIEEAVTIGDEADRAAKVVELEKKAMEEMPWLPIADTPVRLYMNDRVTGVPASFVYLYYPWAAHLGSSE
ncbi:ABC transporter substrate-binding protein [Micrococcus sp. IITD107]|uniref:ABC transporter substrate-binding protein n=1 Tax=Micrococcus sp. IITD107 TaxID=3342790 RepID=UPI0035BB7584